MEELPDDIVLRIFSMLGANMLLGAVPVVCKRWATLARHPEAWRSEEVDLVLIDDIPLQMQKEAMRVLRLAPHLNAIHSSEDEMFPSRSSVDKITAALLKGRLTSLKKVMTFPTFSKYMRAQTAKVLRRFENSLREVELFLRWPEGSNIVTVTTAKDLRRLMQRIASLPRMTSLEFNFDDTESVKLDQDCFAPLSSGCPALRKVIVGRGSLQNNFSRTAVLHAIRGKTLTEVDLGFFTSHDPEVFAALAECKSLNKCSIRVEYLPVIKDMSNLRKLTLYIFSEDTPFLPLVQACPVLSSVTELTFAVDDWEYKTALDPRVYQFVEKFSFKCRNVVELHFQGWLFKDLALLNSVLNCWPNLNFLAIIDCAGIKPSVINNLCSLERMKRVVLKELIVNCREAEDDLNAAVKSLKQKRQDVCIDLGRCVVDDISYDSSINGSYDSDYYEEEYQFTYFDYLRNKYGEDLPDEDLYGLMSSDEEGDYVMGMF